MFKNKVFVTLFAVLACFTGMSAAPGNVFGSAVEKKAEVHSISVGGNGYVVKGRTGARVHNKEGLVDWTDEEAMITVYFRTADSQKKANISIRARGHGTIRLNVNRGKDQTFSVKLDSDDFKEYPVGEVELPNPGYQKIYIKGGEKSEKTFGEISDVVLKNISGAVNYVRNFEPYWGRRGPSVHMRYALPREKNIEYFYNEVVVPKGMDKIGSYFMVNGFGEGYCGIQVNSPKERRVLFSVWSPFETQNPKDIPEHLRVVNLRKGEGVHIGEFGNEGSGGQSFLRYPWEAEKTYGFLTRIRPDGNGNTEYTAYFHVPSERKWMLIASFKRPSTSTWYKGAHSFLENFIPEMGYATRKVLFTNQWAWDKSGKAYEITEGFFSFDSTARSGVRTDFLGGISEDEKFFFLKNCGFFNETAGERTRFERKSSGKPVPMINFDALEKL